MKSKGDVISNVQKAWLMELENARVPAMVTRVLTEEEDDEKAQATQKKGAARGKKSEAGTAAGGVGKTRRA